jgi:hypothetical protein
MGASPGTTCDSNHFPAMQRYHAFCLPKQTFIPSIDQLVQEMSDTIDKLLANDWAHAFSAVKIWELLQAPLAKLVMEEHAGSDSSITSFASGAWRSSHILTAEKACAQSFADGWYECLFGEAKCMVSLHCREMV